MQEGSAVRKDEVVMEADLDVIVADIRREYTIDAAYFVSRGKNSPFIGRQVRGSILYTICGGRIVWKAV